MRRRIGLLLVAHRYDAESTGHVHALAAGAGVPARVASVGHGESDAVVEGIAALRAGGCEGVVVIPLFIASASRLVRRIGDVVRACRPADEPRVVVTPALDDAPEVIEVLTARARALATEPARQAVVLVGHGPSANADVPAWETLGEQVAAAVQREGGFAATRAVVVRDDAPEAVRAAAVRRLRQQLGRYRSDSGRPVVLVPWLVGAGRLTRARLPADIAGHDVRYDGRPLLPHANLDAWVARQLAAARVLAAPNP